MSDFKPTHVANPYPVFARRILHVAGSAPGGALNLTLTDGTPYTAGTEMTARHFPLSGDYLIVGEDGYAYINPSEVFEKKYHPIKDEEHPFAKYVGGLSGASDGVVTAESIMSADLQDAQADTRFQVGDDVAFQPNIGLVGTGLEYDGAVPARVTAARIADGKTRYDVEVFDDAEECWHPLVGVHHMMVLPPPDLAQLGRLVDDATDIGVEKTIQIRTAALEQAAKTYDVHGVDDVLEAAQAYELFLLGRMDELPKIATVAAMPAPKSPPVPAAVASMAPNDGPRVTPELLAEHVDQVYYINPRQAVLAVGGPDEPELDRASFCLLLLRSRALVIGTSIVASLENVDENSGRKMAQQDAANRLSDYLGFVMKHTA